MRRGKAPRLATLLLHLSCRSRALVAIALSLSLSHNQSLKVTSFFFFSDLERSANDISKWKYRLEKFSFLRINREDLSRERGADCVLLAMSTSSASASLRRKNFSGRARESSERCRDPLPLSVSVSVSFRNRAVAVSLLRRSPLVHARLASYKNASTVGVGVVGGGEGVRATHVRKALETDEMSSTSELKAIDISAENFSPFGQVRAKLLSLSWIIETQCLTGFLLFFLLSLFPFLITKQNETNR